VRAWTVPHGTAARLAAGKIHSDFEQRFIQADVAQVDELLEHGSVAKLRELGRLHRQGETYPVHDGDVIHFAIA
jgi:ribosome-binding ATPase YchF (GTP1/OBG family)